MTEQSNQSCAMCCLAAADVEGASVRSPYGCTLGWRLVEKNKSVAAFGLKCSKSLPSIVIRMSSSSVLSLRRLRWSDFTRPIAENPLSTIAFDTETSNYIHSYSMWNILRCFTDYDTKYVCYCYTVDWYIIVMIVSIRY